MTETSPGVEFDERTALVVADVQNDFADRQGSLYVGGGEKIIPAVNGLVAAARAAGAVVVYTQDWHPARTPHFQPYGGIWPVHCVQGSWGAQLHPALDLDGPVVRKGTGGEDGYSGFTARDVHTGEHLPTDLDGILRERGVTRLVVIGLAQDYCVKDTALDGQLRGYDTTVLLAGTRAVNLRPDDDRAANEAMAAAGVTVR